MNEVHPESRRHHHGGGRCYASRSGGTLARKQHIDRAVQERLDEFERKMFVLKMEYEKYFGGIEKFEPVREKDEIKVLLRELQLENFQVTSQRYKFQQLKARWLTLDMYLARNLSMIERGVHPKMKFRADLKDKAREEKLSKPAAAAQREMTAIEKEEAAFRKIYDTYLDARKRCGQSTDLDFDNVLKTLKTQVREIKGRYKCNSVAFRVAIEDGKARLKAVPKQ